MLYTKISEVQTARNHVQSLIMGWLLRDRGKNSIVETLTQHIEYVKEDLLNENWNEKWKLA